MPSSFYSYSSLDQMSLTHSPFTFHLTMCVYSCCLQNFDSIFKTKLRNHLLQEAFHVLPDVYISYIYTRQQTCSKLKQECESIKV